MRKVLRGANDPKNVNTRHSFVRLCRDLAGKKEEFDDVLDSAKLESPRV